MSLFIEELFIWRRRKSRRLITFIWRRREWRRKGRLGKEEELGFCNIKLFISVKS